MSASNPVLEQNRALAMKINEEARRNPQSPYANKIVGIANGQVAVVSEDWNEVSRRLRQLEPDPMKCFMVDASYDYSTVEMIGG
jgi:hypothetical protein